MNTKPFFLLMLYFSVLGVLLSGYLSYNTLFVKEGCGQLLITCGTNPVKILGVSQCIWGFAFFVIVAVLAAIGSFTDRGKRLIQAQVILGICGSLFAGGLSYYELWLRTPRPDTMPSCVYGFFLFLGVLITALLVKNEMKNAQTHV
ncbi:MAG: hypothetical protein Q7T18_10280 [Sedimentisphaerales bacterium]|nr:hypothetical protein [Sedimentisphaerales bacterium]